MKKYNEQLITCHIIHEVGLQLILRRILKKQILASYYENRRTRNTSCGTWYLSHSQVHNDRTVPMKISAIRPSNKGYVAYI